jgi:choline dehydrogenase
MKYDIIIVGAGSSGCVLAKRFTDKYLKVLLIEAGGKDTNMNIHIPAAYSKLHYSKDNWNFYTEPQKHVKNRRMYQPRGKTLGGSSSVNCMAYIRGNALDYYDWAHRGLCKRDWEYEKMLPYFKRSEHNEQFDNEFHGQGGLLNVTHNRNVTPLADAFVEANVECGIPANPDFNGAMQDGAGKFQFTIKDAKRQSTATAFLLPAMESAKEKWNNLTIATNTIVKCLLFEGERVVGVEVIKSEFGTTEKVYCEREVVLCAGAFQTPQILMLSGIGDGYYLKGFGIDSRVELKGVGENLQDHLFTNMNVLCNQRVSYNNAERFPWIIPNAFNYFALKKGPLSSSPLEACSFYRSQEGLDRPDIQFHFAPVMGTDIHDYPGLPKTEGFTILPTLLRPNSSGHVGLHSNKATDAPLINPDYFSDPQGEDIQTMLRGVKKAREILLSDAFAPFRKENELNFPRNAQTDEELIEHILNTCETVYHPVGTCKMGLDSMSVVHPYHLKVYGTQGLRIADASLMPSITSGNTNAPVIAIAEKAFEYIMYRQDDPKIFL